jgi:hypothetical protein
VGKERVAAAVGGHRVDHRLARCRIHIRANQRPDLIATQRPELDQRAPSVLSETLDQPLQLADRVGTIRPERHERHHRDVGQPRQERHEGE